MRAGEPRTSPYPWDGSASGDAVVPVAAGRSTTAATGTAARLSAASAGVRTAGEPDDHQMPARGGERRAGAARPASRSRWCSVAKHVTRSNCSPVGDVQHVPARYRRRVDAGVRPAARATWAASASTPVDLRDAGGAQRGGSSRPSPQPTSSADRAVAGVAAARAGGSACCGSRTGPRAARSRVVSRSGACGHAAHALAVGAGAASGRRPWAPGA